MYEHYVLVVNANYNYQSYTMAVGEEWRGVLEDDEEE